MEGQEGPAKPGNVNQRLPTAHACGYKDSDGVRKSIHSAIKH